MKIVKAGALLGALLSVLIPLALAEPAAAEAPVVARPMDQGPSGPPRGHGHGRLKPFLHPRGADRLNQSKEETAIFAPVAPASPGALVSSSVVAGFDGIDQNSTSADPPDGALAVSNRYIVEAVNSALSVWTKNYDQTGRLSTVTRVVFAADLDGLLGANPNCLSGANNLFGLVSDPSVDYDATNDRFLLSMISFDQLAFTSSLCVAVTQSGDPSGNWFVYAFPISPAASLFDFPRAVIGSDGQFYVTGNLFVCCDVLGNPVLDHARVYAFKTSDMYVGGQTTPRFVVVGNDPQTNMPADSLTPARAVGVSGMYFVSASNPASPDVGSTITLWKWSDPFGSNLFTQQGAVTVSPYTQPPAALQLGGFPAGVTNCTQSGANCVETNDARNLTAYWSGSTVWAAHSAGCAQGGTPVACVQWYQLGNLDGAPTLLQQGIVDDPSNPGRYRYYPSLAVDQNANVALAYAYSSTTEYPGVAYTTVSPSGTQGAEVVLKVGATTFVSPRYGDYFATALDPHDGLTIWNAQEYAKGATAWGTWISSIQIGAAPVPPALSVIPASLDFGTVSVGSSADKAFVVTNTGGGILTGSVSASAPFSIISGGSFSLTLGTSQTVVVRFSPTATGTSAGNVTFTSNGGNVSPLVTGTGRGVSAISPSTVDLASPPASFTITGDGLANLGFGLPVVNFMRGSTMLAQVRATTLSGTTTLTVPFSTNLTVGAVQAQVYSQTGSGSYGLIGTLAVTITDSRPAPTVSAISPNSVDLASPPASFTITGTSLSNLGFGLPVVNFMNGTALVAQARASALTGTTTLTVPFPGGLPVGTLQAQVYSQTGSGTFSLIGALALSVTDSSRGVISISPNAVDLASPPASFTVTGFGFANLGYGLPIVNFMSGSTIIAQSRATVLTGTTTLTVPFPAGLTAGAVQAQVYMQIGSGTFSLIGSVGLTVTDSRQ